MRGRVADNSYNLLPSYETLIEGITDTDLNLLDVIVLYSHDLTLPKFPVD